MRREELYLRDILEAAEHISTFLSGCDFEKWQRSELIRSAVVQKLSVIGEAAARISEQTKARHAAVPWSKVAAFRNLLVHAYFGLDWSVIWQAATEQMPVLARQIASILAADYAVRDDRPRT
jgi:uncharacterized protein with HEPN domain